MILKSLPLGRTTRLRRSAQSGGPAQREMQAKPALTAGESCYSKHLEEYA